MPQVFMTKKGKVGVKIHILIQREITLALT